VPSPPSLLLLLQVYKIGKKGEDNHGAGTDFDVSTKEITPMGGFPHYGVVKEDYLMLKGAVPGQCAAGGSAAAAVAAVAVDRVFRRCGRGHHEGICICQLMLPCN
jgi:hypothetical protein